MYSSTQEYNLSCLVIVNDLVKCFKILFKKLLKRKKILLPFSYFLSRFTTYASMKLAMARRLEQSPDTVTSMTQPDVGPTEVVKEMWHAGAIYEVFVI